MKTVRVGIVGFGTVGKATAEIIGSHQAEITARSGAKVVVAAVCRRSPLHNGEAPAGAAVFTDWRELLKSQSVDVVVETIGGTGAARELVRAALEQGKPVVTANKNLLANYGEELFRCAHSRNLPLGFEAAVAGGVPVVRAIAEGTSGDRVRAIYGILNGTANYILTRMEADGLDFAEALAEAQQKGYAEADPSFDVDGIDARDKLAILARLAFGGRVDPAAISTTGIRHLNAIDLVYARRLDSTIRLIAAAERVEGKVALSVRPWLVHRRMMLAKVEGVNNAVFLEGDKVGTQMFFGRGAGGDATGIAVVSDVIEIAGDLVAGKLSSKTAAGYREEHDLPLCPAPPPVPWYLRLTIRDRPGILARVAEMIAREEINIDFVLQEPRLPKQRLAFVIAVEPVSEPVMVRCVQAINQSEFVIEPVLLLRIASGGA